MSEESKQPEEMESAPAPRQRSGNEWRQWTRDLLVSVLVSVVIITCLYQPVRVEGTSMQPELRNSDRLFINKFACYNYKLLCNLHLLPVKKLAFLCWSNSNCNMVLSSFWNSLHRAHLLLPISFGHILPFDSPLRRKNF